MAGGVGTGLFLHGGCTCGFQGTEEIDFPYGENISETHIEAGKESLRQDHSLEGCKLRLIAFGITLSASQRRDSPPPELSLPASAHALLVRA